MGLKYPRFGVLLLRRVFQVLKVNLKDLEIFDDKQAGHGLPVTWTARIRVAGGVELVKEENA
jgi:hypothetical protein